MNRSSSAGRSVRFSHLASGDAVAERRPGSALDGADGALLQPRTPCLLYVDRLPDHASRDRSGVARSTGNPGTRRHKRVCGICSSATKRVPFHTRSRINSVPGLPVGCSTPLVTTCMPSVKSRGRLPLAQHTPTRATPSWRHARQAAAAFTSPLRAAAVVRRRLQDGLPE